ncbi:MAG: signal peptide peptidase SppA [Deltaproteobacteria bacterium]
MTDLDVNDRQRPRSLLTTVLATIGGLTILGFLFITLLFIWIVRSVGERPVPSGQGIGVVEITGMIADVEPYLEMLRDFRDASDIKAVIVRIDSPGGAVGASQELYEEIRAVDAEKPVVASLASMAASGGYYAALGARHIVANPGTVTGSIGVIMKLPNIGPLLDKIGISTTVIKSGDLKDLSPITRDITEQERQVLAGVMEDIHTQFISAVSESRGLPLEDVERLADGRIFSGSQALDLGLVDELGGFERAVERGAEYAKLTGRPEVVYPQEDRLRLLRKMLREEVSALLSGVLTGGVASAPPISTVFSYEYVP